VVIEEVPSLSGTAGMPLDSGPRDLLRVPELVRGVGARPATGGAQLALDGLVDTAWRGAERAPRWEWRAVFRSPVHIAVLRAYFGDDATKGIPRTYHWEARAPRGERCEAADAGDDQGFVPIAGTDEADAAAAPPGSPPYTGPLASPSRRSWFVDVDACALRLVMDRTNSGVPVIREISAYEGARNVLRGAFATDDGSVDGFGPEGAVDGTYAHRWVGAPGRDRWTLTLTLPERTLIDRVRLVLGFDATGQERRAGTAPTPGQLDLDDAGRTYGIAFAPAHYRLEGSADGRSFFPLATTPMRADHSVLPLRRRLVTLARPRSLRALRLVIDGATGATGVPERGATPVVREIAAYRADDHARVLPPPWILSINANPSGETRPTRGAELANDIYYAKFLQMRFQALLPALLTDDRFARALGPRGELLTAPPTDPAGEVLESIEGDDPTLEPELLAGSSPPPIAVLSGSNDWDYAAETGPDARTPSRWHWDPLRDATEGGIARLHRAVKERMAPFLGFCGGAQILALLEAKPGDASSAALDGPVIDRVLRRTTGHPIRGFASTDAVERAWPGDSRPRAEVAFDPHDSLFVDIAGPSHRFSTGALPESHADAVRPDAFLSDGPLRRFELVATSAFCGPTVVPGSNYDPAFPNPAGAGSCVTVPEAFRSRSPGYPIIGAQFHAEQRDFAVAGPGDPPESVADGRLFLAAAYEEIVDAYLKYGR
jgi:hypothetical protein